MNKCILIVFAATSE